MYVWNVLPAAHWKYRTQNIAICAPSHNLVGSYLRNWGTYRQSEKIVKQRYFPHISLQYSEVRPTNGWDLLASLRHTCKFQRVSRLGSVTAQHSSSGRRAKLRHWTEGATYIRQGGHHVGPIFLVCSATTLYYTSYNAIWLAPGQSWSCNRNGASIRSAQFH